MVDPSPVGRRRRSLLVVGIAALVLVGVVAGAVAATRESSPPPPPPPDPGAAARRFLAAWERGDLRAMHRLAAPGVRRQVGRRAFARRYAEAAAIAGATGVRVAGPVTVTGRRAEATVAARTREWGPVRGRVRFRLVPAAGDFRVAWRPRLVFPGLRAGERLDRDVVLPVRRGRILSRGGAVLAEGDAGARTYPAGPTFAVLTGALGPPPANERRARRRAGWPASWPVGRDGLERSLEPVLAGTPAQRLLAVSAERTRRLAVSGGRRPHDVTTTLSASMQEAVSAALGGRYGGAVVLNARTGAVLASGGIGMDATQPPGSGFKVVTAAAALERGDATPETTYPYVRSVEIDGFDLRNFRREICGGTLVDAFAHSCNSVFAPLAAEIGAGPLVRLATRFGFNRPPSVAYPAPTSTTPAATAMHGDLGVGVAGIGQGGVVATPLQMAAVAQTIAARGVQRPPFLVMRPDAGERHQAHRVVSARTATAVSGMMQAVVSFGTGVRAALAGVSVAGKTGTAEIGPGTPDDAWFIGYAPADRPRVAVAVLVVGGGVGGEVAAPIAGQVLAAALAD